MSQRSQRRLPGYGGVLVAIKTDLISEPISLVGNTSELQAVKVTLVGENLLIICGAYRPTNRDVDYIRSLCDTVQQITQSNSKATIWLAGDFNLPDIDWNNETIIGIRYPKPVNEAIINMLHSCELEHMVDFPTRNQNILDLFMTNRPTLINRCEPMPGISDHDMVYINSNVSAKREKLSTYERKQISVK